MPGVFDYVDAILLNKKQLIVDEQTEKEYAPFIVNRALSNHPDTVLYAQEMNINSHLDKALQNSYLINTIRPSKRFAKWNKKKENENIELIRRCYGYNYSKAKVAASILSKEQLKIIKKSFGEGENE